MSIAIDPTPAGAQPIPLFRAGFRPFFLGAALAATLLLPAWLAQLFGGGIALPYAPSLWHGHEMLFGFAGAALGGFMLTAVPNWTGAPGLSGVRLAALAGLWLAARLAFAAAGAVPVWLGTVLSLAFPPALALAVVMPLLRAGKKHNLAFLAALALFMLADALVQGEMLGWTATGQQGLWLGVFILLTLIAMVGGRIIPGFTRSGLAQLGVTVAAVSRPRLDAAAIIALALTGLTQAFMPGSMTAAVLALVAAVLHAVRLAGWHGWRTGRLPLLWILHLGYLWLPVGLLLLGLSGFIAAVTPQMGLHALTVGAIGTMIMGVMSRAALGHSGRTLQASRLTVLAFGVLLAAGLVRVGGVLVDYSAALWLSGLLWSLAFGLFVTVYAPICWGARPDGKTG